MSGIADWQDLGIFPLQDHESDVPLEIRQSLMGMRLVKMTDPQDANSPDDLIMEFGTEDGLGTIGDIHPWFFWQTGDRDLRGMGSWAMSFAAMTVEGGSGGFARGGTGTVVQPSGIYPIGSSKYATDPRYKKKAPGWPDGFPTLPQGVMMLAMPGTDESQQQEIMLHTDPRLIAAHVAGPGSAGTLVCDLQGNGEICMDGSTTPGVGGRHARLQSMMRVIAMPDGGIPMLHTGPGNSIAWNLAGTEQEGIAGYGLCYARLAGRTGPITRSDDPIPRLPTPITPQPRNPKGINALSESGGPEGAGSQGNSGDEPKTPREFGEFRPTSRKGYGLMAVSTEASGPLHAGSVGDKHLIGYDADGHALNSGHISTSAYFYGDTSRDGPLLFEGLYPYPRPQPLKARVHLSWDPALKHGFIGGPRDGKWRWWSEYHVVIPDSGDPPGGGGRGGGGSTGRPGVPTTPTPGTPSTPTPKTPGGGRGPTPSTPGGGRGPTPSTPGGGKGPTPSTPGGGRRTPGTPGARLPTPTTPQPRNPDPRSPSRQNPSTPREPYGPLPEPMEPEGRETPITPYPKAPKTPTGPSEPSTPLKPYTDSTQHAIERMKGEAPQPTGSKILIGDVQPEDVGLYTLHHPFSESFTELAFRPQLMVKGKPSFVHNALSDADFIEADEGVRPQVITARSWGAQDASGEWDYVDLPIGSRARGGTANGGMIFTPPEFEMEDYFGIGSATDVSAPTTKSYFTVAPGVGIALGLPNLDGGLEAKSIVFDQDETTGNFKGEIKQLDSSRVEQTLIDMELDQSSSEVVVGIGGTQAFRVPRGTQAQRPSSIAPVGGELRIKTDGGTDVLELYDAQNTVWTTLSTGAGVTDHGALTGLADDDHSQYHNDARGDARYTLTTDLGSVAASKGASLIGVEDSGGNYTATDVEGVLAELAGASGVTTFVGLSDTPSAYTSAGLKSVRVNTGATALEFIDMDTLYHTQTELNSTATNNGASLIGVEDSAANFLGSDVEAILAELAATAGTTDHGALTGLADDDHSQYHTDARGDARYSLTTDLASVATGKGASSIGVEDAAGHFSGATVEAVLAEIQVGVDAKPTTFTGLSDTPASYATHGLKAVRVNSGATALEFVDLDSVYYTKTVIGSTATGNGASLIGVEDPGGIWTAANVETVLAEVAASVVTDHGALTGLTDDGHTQYHTDARGDARYYTQSQHTNSSAGAGDAGRPIVLDTAGQIDGTMISSADVDHGGVTGLGDDDHSQYHTDARGDARYRTQTDLASTTSSQGSSLIGVQDSAGNFLGSDVESVLAEIATDITTNASDLTTHKSSTDHDGQYYTQSFIGSINPNEGASLIGIENGNGWYIGATVEAALDEIGTKNSDQDGSISGNATNLVTHKTSSDHDGRYYTESEHVNASAGVSDAGKPIVLDSFGHIDESMLFDPDIDHGALTGLADDDHSQYHNNTRGDIRYHTKTNLASTSSSFGASLIGVQDSSGNFTGTTVETVLAEIATDIDAKLSLSGGTMTGGLRVNNKIGVNVAALEEIHAADTVRADIAFNLNGTAGISAVGGDAKSWEDGFGFTHTVTIQGGIITEWSIV